MRYETVVIGGGQAGLAMGYHLARTGRQFVILDASDRVGDAWRTRWDALRLFTPALADGLPGTPYPGPRWAFPTRDEFADYLEDYARRWELPVRLRMRVTRLWRDGDTYVVETPTERFEADTVVLATGYDRDATIPVFAAELDPGIRQLNARSYRNPSQLADGDVLIVGAGNSGADIAMDLKPAHRVLLSGRHPGQLPWHIEGRAARVFSRLTFFAFRHILTVRTPIGRKMKPRVLAHSGPLIRIKSADLAAAGIQRVARVAGVRDGRPLLEDGTVLDVPNVVWCTGFRPDTSWVDLPGFADGLPEQYRGVVPGQQGLYLLGGLFQYSLSSSMIQGVGRDAGWIAQHIAESVPTAQARQTVRGEV